jgi:hypothetical protein
LFKYVVKSVASLQDQLDLLKWQEELKCTLSNLSTQSGKPQVSLEHLTSLVLEGKKKGFGDCPELQKLKEILKKVNDYKTRVLKMFEVEDSEEESLASAAKSKTGRFNLNF